MLYYFLDQRCPTLSPIATCSDKHFKYGDIRDFLANDFFLYDEKLYTGVPLSVLPIPRSTHLSVLKGTDSVFTKGPVIGTHFRNSFQFYFFSIGFFCYLFSIFSLKAKTYHINNSDVNLMKWISFKPFKSSTSYSPTDRNILSNSIRSGFEVYFHWVRYFRTRDLQRISFMPSCTYAILLS